MADEGSRLLEALSKVHRRRATKRQGDARWLRIRVSDVHTNKTSARVNLPVGIVDVGLRMGVKIVPNLAGMEIEELSDVLRQVHTGKIINIMDEDDGQRVENYFE